MPYSFLLEQARTAGHGVGQGLAAPGRHVIEEIARRLGRTVAEHRGEKFSAKDLSDALIKAHCPAFAEVLLRHVASLPVRESR